MVVCCSTSYFAPPPSTCTLYTQAESMAFTNISYSHEKQFRVIPIIIVARFLFVFLAAKTTTNNRPAISVSYYAMFLASQAEHTKRIRTQEMKIIRVEEEMVGGDIRHKTRHQSTADGHGRREICRDKSPSIYK